MAVNGDVYHRKGTTKPIQLKLYSNGTVINLTNVTKAEVKLINTSTQVETSFNSVDNPTVVTIASPATSGIIEITPSSNTVFTADGIYEYYVRLTDSGGISSIPQNTQYVFKTDDWF